jgi:hypothetical protein
MLDDRHVPFGHLQDLMTPMATMQAFRWQTKTSSGQCLTALFQQ